MGTRLDVHPRDQQQLDREVTNFRRQSYAPTTKSTYMSQMRSYLSFCVYYGYQPLPAAALTLNRYAAFLARSLSASSIPAYLNAIRILHLEHGLSDPTKNNFQLASTLRGIKRVKGLTVSQKKPITPQILLAFKSHLHLDSPLHATFWAVCLVAFFLASFVRRICYAKDQQSLTHPNTCVEEISSSSMTGPSLSIDGRRPSNLVSAF
ncbi:unnamed protein product [Porites lobata]|uniref:Core-binding (CB) domain-containing protein n=1 Tax=Porites lobata TaxID=104759 RepID=A0ABN8NH51_9CNID|nr:unnamed protein product [Porites lobata]